MEKRTSIEAATEQVGGVPVSVRRAGTEGRGLILLHGWGCSAQMMSAAQEAFAPFMRTLSLDFPGHGAMGKAPEPPGPWGVPEYAGLVARLIERYALAPCDVIAHSFGCRVAILLAAEHPEQVGRMILTGAAGIPKPKSRESERRQGAYRLLRSGVSALERAGLFRGRTTLWQEALVQRYGSSDYKALSPGMRETFKKVISLDLTPMLPRVQAPAVLFWGTTDEETPIWMGRIMEEKMKDAALIPEEGAGHFAYLERPDAFLRIAKSFLLEGRET